MRTIFFVLATASAALAQPAPVFDVAVVRAYKPDPGAQGIQGTIVANGVLRNYSQVLGQRMQLSDPVFAPSGRVTMRSITMRELLTQSYPEIVRPEYLQGGPNWLDADRFELLATAPPGTPVETLKRMLQPVLADRFHLALHREQKPMPVFALTAGRKERKLQPASDPGDAGCTNKFSQADGHAHVTCSNITIADLAARLPRLEPFDLDRPVVNATALPSAYDFRFDWTPHGPGSDPAGVTIFDAMEKLGLKLEPRKQPMTVLVIDRVDRTPTGN
jgi:uncharacterized protein (TIGR03435 family)